jgi:hypothetical protein
MGQPKGLPEGAIFIELETSDLHAEPTKFKDGTWGFRFVGVTVNGQPVVFEMEAVAAKIIRSDVNNVLDANEDKFGRKHKAVL